MALSLDATRAELDAVQARIDALHLVERTEGAGRAHPALHEAHHRREELRARIRFLEAQGGA